MQKVGTYIILLVVGALIGVVAIGYLTINQNPTITEQVKVTIQGIDYKVADSILEIELLNDAPEKNLEGKVVVYQDENQWTNDVNWDYTGYGKAQILCSLIDENKSFQVTYIENNPKKTYLDRVIDWNEISINNQGSTVNQAGAILTVENVRFFIQGETKGIEIILRNSGTADAKIAEVYAGSSSSSLAVQNSVIFTPTSQIVAQGSTLKVTIQYDWTEGTRYHFKIATELGQNIPFSEVCSDYVIGFMETTELTIVNVSFTDDGAGAERIDVYVTNSGTATVTISQVRINGNTITTNNWVLTSGETTIAPGDNETVEITSDYTPGNKYSITFFANDGTMICSFTDTA